MEIPHLDFPLFFIIFFYLKPFLLSTNDSPYNNKHIPNFDAIVQLVVCFGSLLQQTGCALRQIFLSNNLVTRRLIFTNIPPATNWSNTTNCLVRQHIFSHILPRLLLLASHTLCLIKSNFHYKSFLIYNDEYNLNGDFFFSNYRCYILNIQVNSQLVSKNQTPLIRAQVHQENFASLFREKSVFSSVRQVRPEIFYPTKFCDSLSVSKSIVLLLRS